MAPLFRPIEQARSSMNFPMPVPFDATNDHLISSAGAAVAITLAANAKAGIVLRQIFCSYSAAPAAGSTVQVEDGSGTVIWKQAIGAGPNTFTFDPPKVGTKNTAMIITVSAGGGAVLAYLDVNAYVQE